MKKLLSLAMVIFLATASVSASPYQHDKNCTKECCKKDPKCCKENCKDEKCTEACAKKCETKPACCTKQKPA